MQRMFPRDNRKYKTGSIDFLAQNYTFSPRINPKSIEYQKQAMLKIIEEKVGNRNNVNTNSSQLNDTKTQSGISVSNSQKLVLSS